jgi:hypothetical protein
MGDTPFLNFLSLQRERIKVRADLPLTPTLSPKGRERSMTPATLFIGEGEITSFLKVPY